MSTLQNNNDGKASRSAASSTATPFTVLGSQVACRQLEWLWPNRIPLGKLTLLVGDPEQGKSFLTMDLAARVTRGSAWPDGTEHRAPCGSVIVLAAEDQADDTIVPRLKEAGADLDKCVLLQAARGDDGLSRLLHLDRDLGLLRQTLLAVSDCRLVVIDPISAYLGQIDGNSNTNLRTLLFPLSELAAERGISVVMVSHLNKRSSARALYRTMGSMAFVAVSRAAWLVVRDPERPERRLMLSVKNNLTETPPGIAFRLAAASKQAVARIEWDPEPIEQGLAEALQQRSGFNAAEQVYRDTESWVAAWLREQLSDGPIKRSDLWLGAMLQSFSDAQMYRAARRLGVVKRKKGLSWDDAEWSLPEHCGEQLIDPKRLEDAIYDATDDDGLEDDDLGDFEAEDNDLEDDDWLLDDEPAVQQPAAKPSRRQARTPLKSFKNTLKKLVDSPAKRRSKPLRKKGSRRG